MKKEPSARELAIQKKEFRYNTGKPCKWGHLSDRDTLTGACIECRRFASLKQATEVRARLGR